MMMIMTVFVEIESRECLILLTQRKNKDKVSKAKEEIARLTLPLKCKCHYS